MADLGYLDADPIEHLARIHLLFGCIENAIAQGKSFPKMRDASLKALRGLIGQALKKSRAPAKSVIEEGRLLLARASKIGGPSRGNRSPSRGNRRTRANPADPSDSTENDPPPPLRRPSPPPGFQRSRSGSPSRTRTRSSSSPVTFVETGGAFEENAQGCGYGSEYNDAEKCDDSPCTELIDRLSIDTDKDNVNDCWKLDGDEDNVCCARRWKEQTCESRGDENFMYEYDKSEGDKEGCIWVSPEQRRVVKVNGNKETEQYPSYCPGGKDDQVNGDGNLRCCPSECSLCLQTIAKKNYAPCPAGICGAYFCQGCLARALETDARCPECRKEAKTTLASRLDQSGGPSSLLSPVLRGGQNLISWFRDHAVPSAEWSERDIANWVYTVVFKIVVPLVMCLLSNTVLDKDILQFFLQLEESFRYSDWGPVLFVLLIALVIRLFRLRSEGASQNFYDLNPIVKDFLKFSVMLYVGVQFREMLVFIVKPTIARDFRDQERWMLPLIVAIVDMAIFQKYYFDIQDRALGILEEALAPDTSGTPGESGTPADVFVGGSGYFF